jgi:hypothetical protein
MQRLLEFLCDGRVHSTREITRGPDVCAVNAIVPELRKNGVEVEGKWRTIRQSDGRAKRIFEYWIAAENLNAARARLSSLSEDGRCS